LDFYDSINYLQRHKYIADFYEDPGDLTYLYFVFQDDNFKTQRVLSKLFEIQEDYQLRINERIDKMLEILNE